MRTTSYVHTNRQASTLLRSCTIVRRATMSRAGVDCRKEKASVEIAGTCRDEAFISIGRI